MNTGVAYTLVVVIWSTTPLMIHFSNQGFDPLSALFWRMLLAALVGLVVVRASGIALPWHREALASYGLALIGMVVSMALVYEGALYLPSGLISVLFGLSPILSGLFAIWLLDDPPVRGLHWLGIVISVLGLALVFADDAVLPAEGMTGVWLVLLGVVLFALGNVSVKRLGADVHPVAQTVGALLLSLPCYLLLIGLTGQSLEPAGTAWQPLAAVVFLAVFGSVVGFMAWFMILQRLSATTVALVTLVTPVLALLMGAQFNDEHLGLSTLSGVAVVLFGLAVYQWGERLSAIENKQ